MRQLMSDKGPWEGNLAYLGLNPQISKPFWWPALLMLVKSSRVSLWGSNQQQISKCLLCSLPEFGIPPWLLFWSLNHTQFEISDHKVTKVLIHFLFPIQCSIQPIFAHFCCCSKVGSSEGSNSPGPRLTLFADNWEWGTRLQRGAGILEQAG